MPFDYDHFLECSGSSLEDRVRYLDTKLVVLLDDSLEEGEPDRELLEERCKGTDLELLAAGGTVAILVDKKSNYRQQLEKQRKNKRGHSCASSIYARNRGILPRERKGSANRLRKRVVYEGKSLFGAFCIALISYATGIGAKTRGLTAVKRALHSTASLDNSTARALHSQ